jgi:hypothetical protein
MAAITMAKVNTATYSQGKAEADSYQARIQEFLIVGVLKPHPQPQPHPFNFIDQP